MYVPATLALPVAPLSQAGALATQPPTGEVSAGVLATQPPAGEASSAVSTRPARLRTKVHVRGADLDVLAGRSATIAATLMPRLADRRIVLQLRRRHGGWRTVAGTRTGARGRYRLHLRMDALGSTPARVLCAGDAQGRGSHRRLGLLSVFRLAGASWYGGGGSMACGGWLTSSTLGVANKTLPCGTLVTLRYDGRTVRVPVVDRGPYVAGREYDLTEATKRALGFEGTGEVWATD
jgi:rare lipoprotein A